MAEWTALETTLPGIFSKFHVVEAEGESLRPRNGLWSRGGMFLKVADSCNARGLIGCLHDAVSCSGEVINVGSDSSGKDSANLCGKLCEEKCT